MNFLLSLEGESFNYINEKLAIAEKLACVCGPSPTTKRNTMTISGDLQQLWSNY